MDYYLQDDIKIEPLIGRWYAHPFLLSPPSAAFMIRHHIQVMESFVQHPDLHSMALQQPSMRGGPFVESHQHSDVEGIKNLLHFTRLNYSELLSLAAEVDDLSEFIHAASGASLDDVYQKLGQRLAGRVELAYEASGVRAHFRLLEPLFYAAFPPQAHQELSLARMMSDARPYVMSTPRLANTGDLILKIPFGSSECAELIASRHRPLSSRHLDYYLDMQGHGSKWTRSQIEGLFSARPERASKILSFSGPRIEYFGHACVLVDTGQESVLIDPLIGYRVPEGSTRSTLRDLPAKIDCALITHAHHDHYVIETLLQICDRTETLVVPRTTQGAIFDPSLELVSKHLGFNKVVAPNPFDTIELKTLRIQTVPFLGEHGDLDITSKLGYRIEINENSMIFLADSNNLDTRLYEQIRELYGPTDIAFIGLECVGAPISWTYGPLLFGSVAREVEDGRRTKGSNAARALELVRALGCKRVYIYAMAIEPWCGPLGGASIEENSFQDMENKLFIQQCQAHGIDAELLNGSKSISLSKNSEDDSHPVNPTNYAEGLLQTDPTHNQQ